MTHDFSPGCGLAGDLRQASTPREMRLRLQSRTILFGGGNLDHPPHAIIGLTIKSTMHCLTNDTHRHAR
ncbi:hypothetical protein AC244_06535 [Ensifer adhaerens]|uniref:Uncharacterized protein n=1 Tax=Ensifer adhaerens TaxID=106592 RepID=A0A0L8C2C6_ENSAD|nr:hypothetical protein AC244_06535 [Ensifer adhaerens]